jgi:hypothetical protein
VNLPRLQKESRFDGDPVVKITDSTLNFVPPQSAVEEVIFCRITVDKSMQTPTHIEAPTPQIDKASSKMGSNLINNRKLNKKQQLAGASDTENKLIYVVW